MTTTLIIALSVIALSCIITGQLRAVRDVVFITGVWQTSIFSRFPETSFWGPADKTHLRKDRNNKFISWLFHNPLAWTTDIWHAAPWLSNAITFLATLPAMSYVPHPYNFIVGFGAWVTFAMSAHIGITYIYKK